MSIICSCPACQAKFQIGEHAAGKRARCPKCNVIVDVPVASHGAPANAGSKPPVASPGFATAPASIIIQTDRPSAPPPKVDSRKPHGGGKSFGRSQRPWPLPLLIGGSGIGMLLLVVVAILLAVSNKTN